MQSEKRIISLLKSKYNLAVGERAVEDLKLTINKITKAKIKVSGRSYETGRKKTISVPLEDLIK